MLLIKSPISYSAMNACIIFEIKNRNIYSLHAITNQFGHQSRVELIELVKYTTI